MDEDLERFAAASRELARLKEIDANFRAMITNAEASGVDARAFPGATFEEDGSELVVSLLGMAMRGAPRFLWKGGRFVASEYVLTVPSGQDGRIEICRLYLQVGDPSVLWPRFDFDDRSTRICDANNTYVRTLLLQHVADALLQSEVFKPAKPD